MSSSHGQAGASSGAAAAAADPSTALSPVKGKKPKKDISAQLMEVLNEEGSIVDKGREKLADISARRKELQKERKQLSAELRNEARKRARIRRRSTYLTNEDLVEVLTMRQSKKAAQEAPASPAKGAAAKTQ